MSKSANKNKKRVYGRRAGRSLNKARQDALDLYLPTYSVPEDLLSEAGKLNPQKLFNKPYSKFWLEIGFGSGEHLKEQLSLNPDIGYLGAEPFINGMSSFLLSIQDDMPDNVRVLMDDAMYIAKSLSDNSLEGLYILNPDPWHKTRHHKRRIVNQDNLLHFARILKPGGKLVLTTDVKDLADWMIIETHINGQFKWEANNINEWETPPEGWVHTRYERKGAKGASKMCYLTFTKGC